MIELIDVGKTYVSEKKQRVCALRGVNVRFGDRGLVVVLGKSGSGKSTLLNLLGGLDSVTEGEIVVDGVSMKKFKKADYDGYRNGYVGFVFQEYNLLPDFNVKDNVELTLRLSSAEDATAKAAEALRKVELDESYLTRRVNELSGGEKQRVAIARSLAKDSRLILADEPTGNLDSATGESIWRILKSLSESRLVVVVTHDGESASKYADRIVKIADGAVVEDSGETVCGPVAAPSFSSRKRNLSFGSQFRMALVNLSRRKFRTIVLALSSVFCAIALAIMQMLLSFSPFDAATNFVRDYNIEYVSFYSDGYLSSDALDYLNDNSIVVHSVVSGKQEILDMGLTFFGDAMELDENSCYITLHALKQLSRDPNNGGIRSKNLVVDGSQKRVLNLYADHYQDVVGCSLIIEESSTLDLPVDFSEDNAVVIAGIIDTDALNPMMFSVYTVYNVLPHFFATSGFKYWVGKQLFFNRNSDGNFEEESAESSEAVSAVFGDNVFTGPNFTLESNPSETGLVTADGLSDASKSHLVLQDNEIVLSYGLYAKLYPDAQPVSYYVDSNVRELLHTPEHIGEEMNLKFDYNGETRFTLDSVRLVGVYFSGAEFMGFTDYIMYVSYSNLLQMDDAFTSRVIVRTDSVDSFKDFAALLRDVYGMKFRNIGNVVYKGETSECLYIITLFKENVDHTAWIFATAGAVFALVQIFMAINLISLGILSRKKEIGILTALGTSKRGCVGIFIIEALFVSVICFIVTLVLLLSLYTPINALLCSELSVVIPYLHTSALTVAVVFAATVLLSFFSALLPIGRLAGLKPVDAIRKG